jgi:hypothetical protein
MAADLTKVLQNLRPGASWSMVGNDYENIIWHDSHQTKPLFIEIIAEIERIQEDEIRNQYQELRKKEYPPIEQQLDVIYHDGIDVWKQVIKQIKNKYPKPD